ncbi:hypothetical protein CHLRE_02g119900v5 [Chlamydomonas reinhardtii]|uniref:Peptidase C1A papain C-terminal domain-containing protein n=1 Tax=Chlamydomonas reinhardtii TaxID=3055 RepID=A0A2K3E3Q4_CHLRE|nr:uncharacterized protein CHLRE_02g119900v5 [Chlamydomonas reinhardtii]PNW87367.1 hypothetical protein CHLRE_02g119900v5 [Chlamydomonas reinhardtii]
MHGPLCRALAVLAIGLSVALLGVDAGKNWQGHGPRDKSLQKPREGRRTSFNHVPAPLKKEHELPKNWNWCNVDGVSYCVANWNQHIPYYCGSCWVHGTLSAIQDRLKIMKKGETPDVMLARQTLLNCAAFEGYGNGCDGGDTVDVFGYMTDFGLPDEGCMTYNATDHTKFPGHKRCPAHGECNNCMPLDGVETCWPIHRPIRYYLTAWGQVDKGVEAMMSEIYHRGPITCGQVCPEDFTWHYNGGIYKDTSGDTELDHDVEVVGWGEEDGEKYWIVRNSWGTYWGERGFFRVRRGDNSLQLESGDCWYGEPEWQMEQDVRTGKLHGGMWGIKDRNDPDDLAAAGTSRLAEAAAAAVRRGATGGSDSSHRHVIRAAAGEQQ